jgi:hypothetical protein
MGNSGTHRLRCAAVEGVSVSHPAEGTDSLTVACVQLNSREDVAANRHAAERLVRAAAASGARLVVLPETWT